MANGSLPAYLTMAEPNPAANRAPWFKNTAQAYAGIFLWIAFFDQLATGGALNKGGLMTCLLGLVVAGGLAVVLFYFVPGVLGMKTGLPLYVVGTSTFGTKGGYFLPGFFMGVLQIGWYSVATFYAADMVLRGVGQEAHAVSLYGAGAAGKFDIVFVLTTIVWGYAFAFLGAKGLKYVAAVSTFFPIVIIIMLLIGAFAAMGSIGDAKPLANDSLPAFGMIIAMVIGFFATAGAAGADFCSANRNTKDVWMGGITGVWLVTIFAGGLALVTVAGAAGLDPTMITSGYGAALQKVSPNLGKIMLILFAVGSVAPACFCAFIIGNSLSTMLGKPNSRVPITLAGVTVGIVLAALGVAGNLAPFFGLIGASFGPVLGAMAADYLLSGRKWPGPRAGISVPGYAAWLIGFAVGICNNSIVTELIGKELIAGWHPTSVYSFVVGFIVYAVLAKAGLEGKVVNVPNLTGAPAESAPAPVAEAGPAEAE